MKSKLLFATLAFVIAGPSSQAYAEAGPSVQDLSRLAYFGNAIGRAVACGIDIKLPILTVGKWLSRSFSKAEQGQLIFLVTGSIERAAQDQKAGRSPDTCLEITRAFDSIAWP